MTQEEARRELLPCPFCGFEPQVVYCASNHERIMCNVCDFTMRQYDPRVIDQADAAREKWNRRVEHTRSAARPVDVDVAAAIALIELIIGERRFSGEEDAALRVLISAAKPDEPPKEDEGE